MQIISNCFFCGEHALHVLKDKKFTMMQCLYCGYATSDKFIGDKIVNVEYKKLTDEMKRWSKEYNGRVWIPGILTLPEGMVYPTEISGMMKWGYAEMVDIPANEQEQYPLPDGNGFHIQKYDTDSAIIYDNFYKCLEELNKKAKGKRASKLKLPKLKKVTSDANKI